MIAWINKKRNKKGFTLVELIVVIAILGILVALAVPRLTGSRQSANRSAVLSNLRTIESALSIAEAEGAKIEGRVESVGTGTSDNPEITAATALEVLVEEGYLSAEPEGPGGVQYGLGTDSGTEGRAIVKFAEADQFGFTGVTISGEYILDDLTGDGANAASD